jgi:carbon monoxide dehydrogenase subunit G
MSDLNFTTEIYINAVPERVLDFLEDLSDHDKIHPLIVSVEELDVPEEQFRRYRITDRVPMGPFKVKAVYEADIWRTDAGNLKSIARQSPGVVLHNTTTATAQANGTLLREVVSVKAPSLLQKFVFRQAKESHQKMFERVKAYLETE